MLIARSAAVLAVLTAACTTPTSARPAGPTASRPPSTLPGVVLPSLPADANVFHGANTHIVVPGAKHPGTLFVDVEAHQTPGGTTVTLRATREVDCHVDKADAGAPLWLCTSKWTRRKTLPLSAFTYDGNLGTASLTTTVDGKPLTITWTGYGTPRQQVNENGALLIRHRDAKAAATWGRLRYTDPDGTPVPSLVYHRVTASA
jgi:hypothetical protein